MNVATGNTGSAAAAAAARVLALGGSRLWLTVLGHEAARPPGLPLAGRCLFRGEDVNYSGSPVNRCFPTACRPVCACARARHAASCFLFESEPCVSVREERTLICCAFNRTCIHTRWWRKAPPHTFSLFNSNSGFSFFSFFVTF